MYKSTKASVLRHARNVLGIEKGAEDTHPALRIVASLFSETPTEAVEVGKNQKELVKEYSEYIAKANEHAVANAKAQIQAQINELLAQAEALNTAK